MRRSRIFSRRIRRVQPSSDDSAVEVIRPAELITVSAPTNRMTLSYTRTHHELCFWKS